MFYYLIIFYCFTRCYFVFLHFSSLIRGKKEKITLVQRIKAGDAFIFCVLVNSRLQNDRRGDVDSNRIGGIHYSSGW